MSTIVFPSPESADEMRASLVAGVDQIIAARDAAAADVDTATALRELALQGKAAAQSQRTTVAAFTPAATYSAAQLTAVRDQLALVLERQAAILDALAGFYAYRVAVDENAVQTDTALLFLARLGAGLLDDLPEEP